MRRGRPGLVVAVLALVVAAFAPGSASGASNASKPTVATADPLAILRATANQVGMGDPDLPPVGHEVDLRTYLSLRAEQIALYRGAPFDLPYNGRLAAIHVMDRQLAHRTKTGPVWSSIGPDPIPNGQTSPVNPVSGRVTAIAVDPSNENLVYVGTAQGGVYRSSDGGAHWTPLMDNAASLAIGALALAPSDHTILYVGTGEGNLSGDSYGGVGLYRINNANGSFSIHGPFESRVAGTGTNTGNGGHAFNFLGIQGIAVDPTNADRVYVAATEAFLGMGTDFVCCISPSGDPGLYLSTNATGASPTFSKVAGNLPQSGVNTFFAGTDVKYLPGSSTTLLVGIEDIGFGTTASNGVWRSTNADNANPTFTHITLPNTVFNTRLAVGPSSTVIVAAEATTTGFNDVGRVYKSADGGATFGSTLATASGFCGFQCFYDMAPAIDPTNANKMLVGGAADPFGGGTPGTDAFILLRTTDGLTFSKSDSGLHADSHATAYAPGNTNVVYAGNDGGVFRSADGGASWSSINTSGLSATQFESIAVHPTDPNFTIGGTQDNGTEWFKPDASWKRADFGDGGFSAIDSNAANTTNVTMYHTYFNQQNNSMGYAKVTTTANATDGNWTFIGTGSDLSGNCLDADGFLCAEDPLFYAPLELGPGNPNTVYFGTNVLHRSANGGTTNPVVSQDFGGSSTGRISAIGVSPQNDSVRVVGLNGGGIFGTTTGANPLVDLDPTNQIPNSYVARIVVDPNNSNVAYVTVGGFQGGVTAAKSHVWRTSNLNGSPPTWTAINHNGDLPDVPVNAFVVDPHDSTHLYAGTDVGVYASTNSGGSWAPFGTGLPVVAVFDMAIARPGTANEVLRVATHGRGMYEAGIGTGGAATLTVTRSGTGGGTVTSDDGHINCPGTCSFQYSQGDQVHLTASADGSSTFGHWTGCDSALANACTQTLNGDETVDASFDANGGDTTPPTASMTKPTASLTISKSITLQWNAADENGGSGMQNVDLRVKSAKFNAAFGSFTQPAALQGITGTSSTVFTGAAGTSYCFSVRARDNSNNLSSFSPTACTMVPVDDKTLAVQSGTWQRKTGQAGTFLGTLSVASAKNASLSLASVHAKQVGVLVKKCSTCGTFTVTFNGQTTVPISTQGSGFVVFTMPATATVKTSNVVLKVTSTGKPVQIDAVAASQTGPITTAFAARTVRAR